MIPEAAPRSLGPSPAPSAWLWSALFALAYSQAPLYSGNQHTYMLHGLARGCVDGLRGDWLAGTADPFPLFSGLVALTCGAPVLFHVFYGLLLALYFRSLLLLSEPFTRSRALVPLALLFAHCAAFGALTLALTGVNFSHAPAHLGLAFQTVLGPVFQPSVFGTLLVFSVASYLRGRPFLATAAACAAALFHGSYLLSAAVLTATYMALQAFDARRPGRALSAGTLALILVAPLLYYTHARFGATTPALQEQARAILVEYRIPHHALPARWFDATSVAVLVLILAALVLARKQRPLFWILASAVVASLALTLAQLATSSLLLALLFPWRVSVWVAPIALTIGVSVLGGRLARRLEEAAPRGIAATALACACALAAYGLVQSARAPAGRERAQAYALLREFPLPGAERKLVLIPPALEDFRLGTQLPVFTDGGNHPYKDVEILEWRKRVLLANAYYEAPTPDSARASLAAIRGAYPVTHVACPAASACPGAAERVFASKAFEVYAVEAAP